MQIFSTAQVLIDPAFNIEQTNDDNDKAKVCGKSMTLYYYRCFSVVTAICKTEAIYFAFSLHSLDIFEAFSFSSLPFLVRLLNLVITLPFS